MPENKNAKIGKMGNIKPREITQEMKESYIDYAMSVIVSRALPDVRDGLKPVQRRILYAMYEMGLRHDAKFRKSATVTGNVLGRYHPHGDAPVYGALARMTQDFSLRYPLIAGQGNWGCFTSDTKVRLCDGRSLSFGELIKEQKKNKRHWTFTFNRQTSKIEVAEIKNPRITRKKERLIEVILDNDKRIRCTLDHLFMLRDGSYKKAVDLKPGDSLMPFYTKLYSGEDKNLKGYEMVLQPIKNKEEFTHHLADEWNLKNKIYGESAGRIRHHKDFSKYNNNPDNILRIQWKNHWKLHKEIASWRHQNDLEYVKKIAEGRRKFIDNNREVFSQRAKNLNKKLWGNPDFRKRHSERIKEMWQDPEYRENMAGICSRNLKKLWGRKDFQELLSKLKSKEMKKRWQDVNYRTKKIQELRGVALKMWETPRYREYMLKLMKERRSNPLWRGERSKISKELWKDSEYRRKVCSALKEVWQDSEHRAKYEKNHFSKIAKKLWEKPGIREFHREKLARQRQDEEFRKKQSEGVRASNRRRMKENSGLIEELTERAKIALREKWQDPTYKKRVIKSRILGYVSSLLKKYPTVTPKIYDEKKRSNKGVPKLKNSLNYFNSFSEIIETAKRYNHGVVKTKILRKREDVYDLTVEPWHNFVLDAGVFVHNSIDDPTEIAAMRYTEAKLSRVGEELLKDIEKDTVDFVANFDGTRNEPLVLPSPLPNLLLNGSIGIAVAVATNIPPHNLSELCDASIHLLDHPKASTEELFEFVLGPDFPTGGIIYDKDAILAVYSQGRGSITMRGKAEIKEISGGARIIISEIPFGVRKSMLVRQIVKLVQDKKIQGVKDVRDESDREGIRVVVDLRPDSQPQRILNFLFRWTSLQTSFHMNMIGLVDGIQPKRLNLAESLSEFLKHRTKVTIRKAKFDLKKSKEREHILEGFHKALKNIDAVIKTIKASKDRQEAEKNLIKKFKLTSVQANAILEMKLASLARLERQKIEEELKQTKEKIKELAAILKSPQKIKNIIKKDLEEYKKLYGDQRRTKIVSRKVGEMSFEDLVPQEPAIITLTQNGYIKRVKPSNLRLQKRGGKGMLGQKVAGEDVVEHLIFANTHDNLLFFTDSGKVFQTKVFEVPEAKRVARGKSLFNFLDIGSREKVLALLPLIKNEQEIKYFVMATKKGIIKKTEISEFENVRRSGLIAINLKKDDSLVSVRKSAGEDNVILVTKKGKAIRFKEKDIRSMGRQASGVKGIRLAKGNEVIGMEIIKLKVKSMPRTETKFLVRGEKLKVKKEGDYLLVISENGYGKRTSLQEYRLQKRGGAGIKAANVTKKTGELVAIKVLNGQENHLIAISQQGQVIKMSISGISKIGRATQGVRIMRLDEQDRVASIAVI